SLELVQPDVPGIEIDQVEAAAHARAGVVAPVGQRDVSAVGDHEGGDRVAALGDGDDLAGGALVAGAAHPESPQAHALQDGSAGGAGGQEEDLRQVALGRLAEVVRM